MGFSQPVGENDANPKTRLFHVDFKMPRSEFEDLHPRLLRLTSQLPYGLHLLHCKLSEQKFPRYITFFCFSYGHCRIATSTVILEFLYPFHVLKYTDNVRGICKDKENKEAVKGYPNRFVLLSNCMIYSYCCFLPCHYAFEK